MRGNLHIWHASSVVSVERISCKLQWNMLGRMIKFIASNVSKVEISIEIRPNDQGFEDFNRGHETHLERIHPLLEHHNI